MKQVLEFIKTTLIGGLLVILPVWLVVLLLLRALKSVIMLLKPITALLPKNMANENLIALAVLVVACFLVGLLVRTHLARRPGEWVESHFLMHIPGYTLLRGMTRRLTGRNEDQTFQPALVEIEEALVPAFIVEKHDDGQFTVFVSSSPTPMAGTIYILQPERVHPVDVPLTKAMVSIAKWGAGSDEWLKKMLPKSV